MFDSPRDANGIAELLVHIGRSAQSEDAGSALTAAQWTCLRFFARANSSTRTPSGFANFHATTRGTASQIVRALERRGLILRKRSERDGRSVCFELTESGRAALGRDPLCGLIAAIGRIGAPDRARLRRTLSRLADELAHLRQAPAFGTCRDCRHFASEDGAAYCACMAAALAAEDMDKLCASYTGAHIAANPEGDTHGQP